MSNYRKAFLIWWTALLLFIAIAMYVNWDQLQPGVPLMALIVVTLSFGSWLPSAFLRLVRP